MQKIGIKLLNQPSIEIVTKAQVNALISYANRSPDPHKVYDKMIEWLHSSEEEVYPAASLPHRQIH